MCVQAVVAFAHSLCAALQGSQAKTLAALVAALAVGHVSLAASGLQLSGGILC